MSLTENQQYQLKKFIKELKGHRGRHTELVSVYIPQGYDMNKIIAHLDQEKGTATNIKSATTRKNVIDSLERMTQHLRLFKKTPEHGLAVFSGNVAEREGQQDFEVWSIEPPIPVKTRIYRCDKTFVLDILEDMMQTKEVYGLVVVDRRDATLAFLKGKTIIPILKTHSEVPGKTRAGGQSAARFERLREGAKIDHFKKVAEYMKEQFFGNKNLKGIIIGGPGPTKNDFIDNNYLVTELKDKVLAVKDLSYTDEFGLKELLEKSEDVLAGEDVVSEKKIMGKFFNLLSTKEGMVSYGLEVTTKHLEAGVVDTLLLSEEVDEQVMEELEAKGKELGSETKIISNKTTEGAQLSKMGKVAAILRYEVGQ